MALSDQEDELVIPVVGMLSLVVGWRRAVDEIQDRGDTSVELEELQEAAFRHSTDLLDDLREVLAEDA